MTEQRQRWILDPAATDEDMIAMFVERRIPNEVTRPHPIVLVHGGGGQGTDWGTTPDGRPGWADLLVAHGWDVYVIDRPGHGRAPGRTPGHGARGTIARVFAPGDRAEHTQWPGPGGADDPAVRVLAASAAGLPLDLVAAQSSEQRLLVTLLEEIGTAVLVGHSLGACATWLVAEARPDLVAGVVALEPAGPPYLDVPGTPLQLMAGITAAPLGSDGRLTGLPRLPVAIVQGEVSSLGASTPAVVAHLREAGVHVNHIELAAHGLHGNGHGFVFELNNREVLDVVMDWITTNVPDTEALTDHLRTGEQA
jgi:pimeloyl-ACP methyl ester carboxylesterase